MSNIFTGSMETPDGVLHPNAVARLFQTNITDHPILPECRALAVINYYHDEDAMDAGKEPIFQRSYNFTFMGEHPMEEIFVSGEDIEGNIFAHLQSLPEFAGWTLYAHVPEGL